MTQLLRIEGASEIVVSCSPRSQDLIRELGGTKIINYQKDVLNQVLENSKDKPFDYILDCWGGTELFPHIDHILVKNGTYHSIVGDCPGSGMFPFLWGLSEHLQELSQVLFISSTILIVMYFWELKTLDGFLKLNSILLVGK